MVMTGGFSKYFYKLFARALFLQGKIMSRSLVGTRIRERRKLKKISQCGLAEQVGISASYLNLIEHNQRGIGGKTLLAIARALELKPGDLTEGADLGLINRIKKAAGNNRGSHSEIVRIEEFIGRFPGFANLISALFEQQEVLQQNLQALSDKISNDPFFAEAMHLMLTTITTIHSTADILNSFQDIPEEQKAKFLENLLVESHRLSKTAEDILNHFDRSQKAFDHATDDYEIETFLDQNDFYIKDIETKHTSPGILVKELDFSENERERSFKILSHYADMAEKLPIRKFLNQARRVNFDPLKLATVFGNPLSLIFMRLAHVPASAEAPNFGIMECDGSGAVLYRKKLSTFSFPRFSSACPLWPVYRALGQPQQPICAMITMHKGERFLTY